MFARPASPWAVETCPARFAGEKWFGDAPPWLLLSLTVIMAQPLTRRKKGVAHFHRVNHNSTRRCIYGLSGGARQGTRGDCIRVPQQRRRRRSGPQGGASPCLSGCVL